MAQESTSILEKKDSEVKQFKEELQLSYDENTQAYSDDVERLRVDLQKCYDESCLHAHKFDVGVVEHPDQQVYLQAPIAQPYATPPTQGRLPWRMCLGASHFSRRLCRSFSQLGRSVKGEVPQ